MSFYDALLHYRCYSHSTLTSMLNDDSYFNSLTENQKKGLYSAWEEYYYVQGNI